MLTDGAMGATAWSSSAPNGRIAVLGTEVVILGADGSVSIGRSELHRRDDISGVLRIATGARHAPALEVDGSVWTWGENDMGQLGGGPEARRLHAEPLRPLAGISGPMWPFIRTLAWNSLGPFRDEHRRGSRNRSERQHTDQHLPSEPERCQQELDVRPCRESHQRRRSHIRVGRCEPFGRCHPRHTPQRIHVRRRGKTRPRRRK